MKTVSLRRRVTLTAAVVSGTVLVLVALIVHALFGVVVNRSQNAVLNDRVQLARQLAAQGISPTELVDRVDNHSVRARLVLADGRAYGSLTRAHLEDGTAKTRTARLSGSGQVNDAKLTLEVDTPLLSRLRSRLGFVLILATTTALAVIAAALWLGLRRALRPLDTMTLLARDIARGRRGTRLQPARTDTELGRTAAAFDEMLDALEGAEARARDSEQRIRTFVGDAAHELRTPIAGIRALAEAAVQQPADANPEDRQRIHLLLAREAQRAGRLVDDLLDLARIDAGLRLRRERVDLAELVGAELEQQRILHPDIDFQLTGRSEPIAADPARVAQILANLLGNAAQAIRGSGAITVRLRSDDEDAVVTVTDNGPGVPAEDRERIFDRLVRLDPARENRPGGSGLGLPIARGLARAHGGELTCAARSDGGKGAVFTLRLPVTGEG
ncbi:sensor histidine kinase [Nocardia inohanensis]|uniref:sensor histidine kinase n=1 Tax=Nocardia inohanensis TaxID=209246 RepID=UPI000A005E2C|nr:HAMP domain-containing sensor histidine kinase [Nocardia inohanensis]